MPEYVREHFARSRTDGYVPLCVANRQRLGEAKRGVTRALDDLEVPYVEPAAGFFLLLDVRRSLRARRRPPSTPSGAGCWRKRT
jgi:hypothetical protein